jgi:hypothetical protein
LDRVPPSPDSTRQATAFVAPPARASRGPIVATVVVIVVVALAAALVLMLR